MPIENDKKNETTYTFNEIHHHNKLIHYYNLGSIQNAERKKTILLLRISIAIKSIHAYLCDSFLFVFSFLHEKWEKIGDDIEAHINYCNFSNQTK